MDREVKEEERLGGQRGKERVKKREGEEADGEIVRDEVGKDKIRRIASQPTHVLFTSCRKIQGSSRTARVELVQHNHSLTKAVNNI